MSLTPEKERSKNRVGELFSKITLTPNQYTLFSLLWVFLSFYSLIRANFPAAAFFFLLAVFFDFIDGAVARFKEKATKIGAYLDTIFDRYVEGIILLGFLFLPLPRIGFGAEIWIFLALFGSLMTTYAKAAAKEKEIILQETKKDWLGRPARVILIFLSLIFGIFNFSLIIYPILILAFFSNLTAVSRILANLKS